MQPISTFALKIGQLNKYSSESNPVFITDLLKDIEYLVLQVSKALISRHRKPVIFNLPPEDFDEIEFGAVRRNEVDDKALQ